MLSLLEVGASVALAFLHEFVHSPFCNRGFQAAVFPQVHGYLQACVIAVLCYVTDSSTLLICLLFVAQLMVIIVVFCINRTIITIGHTCFLRCNSTTTMPIGVAMSVATNTAQEILYRVIV